MKHNEFKGFLKKHRDAYSAIVTVKMELFVALPSSFQPLTNFTKVPSMCAMGALNEPLEYYNVFCSLCIWSN